MTSIELLIREKLKVALEAEKRQVASGLLGGFELKNSVSEDFGQRGRPRNIPNPVDMRDKRQKAQLNVQKKKLKAQKLHRQVSKTADPRDTNLKKSIARTELSLATQKLRSVGR